MAKQAPACDWFLVGIQAPRCHHDDIVPPAARPDQSYFLASSEATANGTHGCALLVAGRLPLAYHEQKPIYVLSGDVAILYAQPRLLLVSDRAMAGSILCIVAHGPHDDADNEAEAKKYTGPMPPQLASILDRMIVASMPELTSPSPSISATSSTGGR